MAEDHDAFLGSGRDSISTILMHKSLEAAPWGSIRFKPIYPSILYHQNGKEWRNGPATGKETNQEDLLRLPRDKGLSLDASCSF